MTNTKSALEGQLENFTMCRKHTVTFAKEIDCDICKLAAIEREQAAPRPVGGEQFKDVSDAKLEQDPVIRATDRGCVIDNEVMGMKTPKELAEAVRERCAKWCEQQTGDFARFFNGPDAAAVIRSLDLAPLVAQFEEGAADGHA